MNGLDNIKSNKNNRGQKEKVKRKFRILKYIELEDDS